MSAAHNSVRRRLLLGGAAVAGLAAAGAAAGSAVMARADFGALPTGERLKRFQASPHWQDGAFHNLGPMELSASGRSRLEIMREFLSRLHRCRTSKPISRQCLTTIWSGVDIRVSLSTGRVSRC